LSVLASDKNANQCYPASRFRGGDLLRFEFFYDRFWGRTNLKSKMVVKHVSRDGIKDHKMTPKNFMKDLGEYCTKKKAKVINVNDDGTAITYHLMIE
jgi:ABC-type antimicrobial peptide transport system ATPase subunit